MTFLKYRQMFNVQQKSIFKPPTIFYLTILTFGFLFLIFPLKHHVTKSVSEQEEERTEEVSLMSTVPMILDMNSPNDVEKLSEDDTR